MEMDQITAKLQEVINDVLEIENASMTKNLTDYGVNSVSLIRLIVATESKFDVAFTDYELALSSYDCFADIAKTVQDKLA